MANVVIKPEPVHVLSSNVVGVYPFDAFGAGNGGAKLVNNSSFVFHSEEYTFENADFNPSVLSGDHSIVINQTLGTEDTGDFKALVSCWDNSGNQRGFFIRITTTGQVEYFSSQLGTGPNLRVVTVNSLPNNWQQIGVSVDVSAPNAGAAVTITFNGVAQSTNQPIDTGPGTYGVFSGAKELTIGAIYSSGVLDNMYRGFINQMVITSSAITTFKMLDMYNGGDIKRYYDELDNVVSTFEPVSSTYSSGYSVPDLAGGTGWSQQGAAPSLREGSLSTYLNPYGNSFKSDGTTLSASDWFVYDDQVGAAITLTGTSCTVDIDQTGTFDPDRNSCEALTKGSFDISSQDLWVRFYNYDWNASIDIMSHGAFGFIDDRNDLTNSTITHRVIAPNLANLGNYRCVGAELGIQVGRDETTTVAKGVDVFIRISGSTISYFYNNGGILTSLASDQTTDMGDWVRIKFHARDYNVYSAPQQYGVDAVKIYRTTPTDLS